MQQQHRARREGALQRRYVALSDFAVRSRQHCDLITAGVVNHDERDAGRLVARDSQICDVNSGALHRIRQFLGERVGADGADERRPRTCPRGSDRLIGALSTGMPAERRAEDGLAGKWEPRGLSHEVHIGATEDDNVEASIRTAHGHGVPFNSMMLTLYADVTGVSSCV